MHDFPAILFLPVCSECREILHERINCAMDIESSPHTRGYNIPFIDIRPRQCPHCGALFERVTYITDNRPSEVRTKELEDELRME